MGTLGGEEVNNSRATAISDRGQVVGIADTADDLSRPFLYEGDGPMLDLNDLIPPDSGWDLSGAADINNLGQIVGTGNNPDGEQRTYLLTPLDGDPGTTPIPLPPTAWMGLAMLAATAAAARRLRNAARA